MDPAAAATVPAVAPDAPFWTGATCASVGSFCAVLLFAFGSTPAEVSPAPAHAGTPITQDAASNMVRDMFKICMSFVSAGSQLW